MYFKINQDKVRYIKIYNNLNLNLDEVKYNQMKFISNASSLLISKRYSIK